MQGRAEPIAVRNQVRLIRGIVAAELIPGPEQQGWGNVKIKWGIGPALDLPAIHANLKPSRTIFF